MIIRQKFTIHYNYNVHFTANVFNTSNHVLSNVIAEASSSGFSPAILFVVDKNVAYHHPELTCSIKNYFESLGIDNLVEEFLLVAGGEDAKQTDACFQKILTAIHKYKIDRHSFVIVIGGGAVTDAAGYAAAVAHRGIKLIRIPTTVLAQNDAAIGVKNSINAFGKKNFLGTFAPPYAVINDSTFLKTLSYRTWISGMAEAIKVALVKDAGFFERIEQLAPILRERNESAMQEIIINCARHHLAHIASEDPFETGSSRPLDFGHWSAHKLEQMSNYELLHGEAVSIGITLDSTYANLMGYLSNEEYQRILDVLQNLKLPISHPQLNNVTALLNGLHEFREHLGGKLTISLLNRIGNAFEVHQMNEPIMKAAIKALIATTITEAPMQA